jgi:hypothetical protein
MTNGRADANGNQAMPVPNNLVQLWISRGVQPWTSWTLRGGERLFLHLSKLSKAHWNKWLERRRAKHRHSFLSSRCVTMYGTHQPHPYEGDRRSQSSLGQTSHIRGRQECLQNDRQSLESKLRGRKQCVQQGVKAVGPGTAHKGVCPLNRI